MGMISVFLGSVAWALSAPFGSDLFAGSSMRYLCLAAILLMVVGCWPARWAFNLMRAGASSCLLCSIAMQSHYWHEAHYSSHSASLLAYHATSIAFAPVLPLVILCVIGGAIHRRRIVSTPMLGAFLCISILLLLEQVPPTVEVQLYYAAELSCLAGLRGVLTGAVAWWATLQVGVALVRLLRPGLGAGGDAPD